MRTQTNPDCCRRGLIVEPQIESNYLRRKIVILLLKAHILRLQSVILQRIFSYILSIVRLSLPLGILIELDDLFIQKR